MKALGPRKEQIQLKQLGQRGRGAPVAGGIDQGEKPKGKIGKRGIF